MKALGFMLSTVLISFSTGAFAQSEAKSSFENLKDLAGTWEGPLTTTPPDPSMDGKDVRTIRSP